MIILPRHQLIVVTPPRCGSTTLRELLCGPIFGGFPGGGPCEPDWITKHTQYPPAGCEDYGAILAIRSPVARALSMYRHARDIDWTLPFVRNFPEFVRALLEPARPLPWPGWSLNCIEHLSVNDALRQRLVGLIRTERICEDLARLEPDRSFVVPKLNQSGRYPGPIFGMEDRAALASLTEWGRSDTDLIREFFGGSDDARG
jgi:hypothetical protein